MSINKRLSPQILLLKLNMNAYQPRTDDMQFVLSRVLNAPAQLQALPAFAEVDADLM